MSSTLSSLPSRVLALGASAAVALGGALALGALSTPSAVAAPEGESPAISSTSEVPMRLSYDKPATDWETQSLPIGNGAMGASIFGDPVDGRIQLNEKTLWSGGPGVPGYNNGNYDKADRPNALDEVRQKINDEGEVDPGWVAQKLGQGKTGYGSYQPFGELHLKTPGASGYTDYERSLDLKTATAAVTYKVDGVTYTRQFIASYPDGVIAMHISADQPASVDFTADYRSQIDGGQVTAEDGLITLSGEVPDNGLKYESQIKVVADGGTVADDGDDVKVTGADSATLIWAGGTNYAPVYPDYREDDPSAFQARVSSVVSNAAAKTWDALQSAQRADYQALFERAQLNLNGEPITQPTDKALAAYDGTGPQDRTLEQIFFQYGRYLLISSSRPGSLPANLQGVWNNSNDAPWGADYHPNINLQMNYWSALTTNLSETYEPYVDFIESLIPAGEVSAQKILGLDGWMVNNETTPWGFTGVHNYSTAFWFPEATAWLAVDAYRSYEYSGDTDYLKNRAYPILKETAKFWVDYLVNDPRDNKLVANPSYSPEHGDFTAGAAMSQQLATEVLQKTIKASQELGVDADFRAEVQDVLDGVDPGLRIGSWGQLQEWKDDLDVQGDTHRHTSQLYALFPGDAISPIDTPNLADAAKVTLRSRGDGGTGWSKAWKINFWANLSDGDHAHKLLREQLVNSTYPNMWDAHPPFQIDGNFGATSGIAEMLVRSNQDGVEILPALPSAWQDGAVDGLRGEGGLTIGATWQDGAPTQLRVAPDKSGKVSIRSSVFDGPVSVSANGADVPFTVSDGVATFDGDAGQTYEISPLATVAVSAPGSIVQGGQAEVTVTVSGDAASGDLKLNVPEGWQVSPACVGVDGPGEYTFTVAAPADADLGAAKLTAEMTGSSFSIKDSTNVTVQRVTIPQSDLKVAASSFQEEVENSPVSNVVDGNPDTIWHSQWSAPEGNGMPWLTVDLGKEYTGIELYLLPRQAGNSNGVMKEYNVYVSDDGENWGDPVANGEFPNARDEETITLPADLSASHVKIEWVSSYSDTANFGSLAELNVFADGVGSDSDDLEIDPGTCTDGGDDDSAAADGDNAGADGDNAGSDGDNAGADGDNAGSDGGNAGADGDNAGSDGGNAGADGDNAASDGENAAADGDNASAAQGTDQATGSDESAGSDEAQSGDDAKGTANASSGSATAAGAAADPGTASIEGDVSASNADQGEVASQAADSQAQASAASGSAVDEMPNTGASSAITLAVLGFAGIVAGAVLVRLRKRSA